MSAVFKPGLYAGKVVFVTGGSSGINLRIAEAFGEMGAKVAINGRKVEKLEAAVKSLRGKGITAEGYSADVRDYAAIEGALESTVKAFGPIDVLVCGAAGNFPAPVAMMSSNGFKAVLDIDVLGTFNACRAAFERLTRPGGVIIAISAPQAQVAYPMQAHVCAAKAGVDMLVKTLAMEWGPAGVRVMSIWPGTRPRACSGWPEIPRSAPRWSRPCRCSASAPKTTSRSSRSSSPRRRRST